MLQDFLHLIFPETCICCKEALPSYSTHICPTCDQLLPVLDLENDLVMKKLAGRVPISATYGYLKFNKSGMAQRLLHELKYKDNPELGFFLGKKFAHHIGQATIATEIDLMLPVPLHTKRMKARGYNQSEAIAKGLLNETEVPLVTNALTRIKESVTQTRKGRNARLQNMMDCFTLATPSTVEGKRVGLLDDVITTGATLEACCRCLAQAGAAEIKVFCLAVA